MADTYTTALYKRDAVAFWIDQQVKAKFALLNPDSGVVVRNDNVRWDGPTVTFPVFQGGATAEDLDITGATTSEASAIVSTSTTATVVNKIVPVIMSDIQLRDAYDSGKLFEMLLGNVANAVGQVIDEALIAAAVGGSPLSYDGSAATIDYDAIVDAKYLWNDYQQEDAALILKPKCYADLVKLEELTKYMNFGQAPVTATGKASMIYGMPVVQSRNITTNTVPDPDTFNNLIVLKNSLHYGFRQEVTYNPVKMEDYRTRHEFIFSFYVKKVVAQIEPVIKLVTR